MRGLFFYILLFLSVTAWAQDVALMQKKDSIVPDPHYREDQFYASLTYDLMYKAPKGYSQYSVPVGITVGFLRDFPVNKARNKAIAIGLGYSYSNTKHNFVVQETAGKPDYSIISKSEFDKNKMVLHYLEMPLELRWRTSDSISHQFWRIYTGVKLSYLVSGKTQYYPSGGADVKITNDASMNKLMGGVYIAAGYNTWNFYAYYGFTPLYDNVYMDTGTKINMHPIKLGLMFYIL